MESALRLLSVRNDLIQWSNAGSKSTKPSLLDVYPVNRLFEALSKRAFQHRCLCLLDQVVAMFINLELTVLQNF